MFMCLEWKKIVWMRLSIYVMFIVWLHIKFEHVPFIIHLSLIFSSIIFITSSIIMSQQIKEIIKLIKEKKELVHTIKSILQVFPEGVNIRSLDPVSMNVVSMFANDVFEQISTSSSEADNSPQVSLTVNRDNNFEPQEQTICLLHLSLNSITVMLINENIKGWYWCTDISSNALVILVKYNECNVLLMQTNMVFILLS